MNGQLEDKTAPIREGEELDVAKLEPYLRKELNRPDGAFALEQFPGGHSNLTYMAKLGDLEMVIRRPPFGSKVKSAHDMGREYTVLSHIHDIYGPAPEPLLYCEDESVIGAKFYAMERIRGVIFRAVKPNGLDLTPETVRGACIGLAENLADLHALDWKKAGLDGLRKDGSFVERQVLGWIKRYAGSQTDDIPNLDRAFAWCKEHLPAETGACLIHNDYKFDNVILDGQDITKVIGVLDWEMATIGDPLMDLGTSIGYWENPGEEGISTSRCFLMKEPGSITRKEFVEAYANRTGRDVPDLHWYYVFAIAKLAVILQQIYYRYHQGLTKDERFAPMIEMVKLLGEKAARVIDEDSI